MATFLHVEGEKQQQKISRVKFSSRALAIIQGEIATCPEFKT